MTMPADSRSGSVKVRELLRGMLHDPGILVDMPTAEMDLALRVARRGRVLGRIATELQRRDLLHALPRIAADQLQSAIVAAEARARVGRWELDRIAWALNGMPDVPLVAMKGCAYLLAETPNARGRMFSDVDLLVPEARVAEVEAELLRRGWRATKLTPYDDRYYRRWTHELPPLTHVERGVELDLHHAILMRTARLKPSSELLFAAARPVPGSRIKVLAPVDMVLHAMVHLFYGGEIADTLRELVDIDLLLRHFAATEAGFWDGFWPRVEALDLARPAFYGLHYACELLGTPVPEPVIAAARAGAPVGATLSIMDWLVIRALFPQHPDAPTGTSRVARRLLYVRSHWVKMAPVMLARHLSYKFYLKRIKRAPAVKTEAA